MLTRTVCWSDFERMEITVSFESRSGPVDDFATRHPPGHTFSCGETPVAGRAAPPSIYQAGLAIVSNRAKVSAAISSAVRSFMISASSTCGSKMIPVSSAIDLTVVRKSPMSMS